METAFWLFESGIVLLFLILVFSYFSAAPPVFSSPRTAESMIKLAELKAGMTAFDLGSGDGRLLLLAAGKGARAVGYEINPLLVLRSLFRAFRSPYAERISVRWASLWSAEVGGADVVFVYLLPRKMEKLRSMLLGRLKPGALVVSNSFVFRDWPPCRTDEKNRVYVFRVGEQGRGA